MTRELTSRLARRVSALAAATALGAGFLAAASPTAMADQISSDKAEAAAVTAVLTQYQNQMNVATQQYAQDQQALAATQTKVAADKVAITAEKLRVARLHAEVASEAITLFTDSGSTSDILAIAQGTISDAAVVQEDVSTASSIQQQTLTDYTNAEDALQSDQAQLTTLVAQETKNSADALNQMLSFRHDIDAGKAEVAGLNSQIDQLVQSEMATEMATEERQAAARAAAQAAAQAAVQPAVKPAVQPAVKVPAPAQTTLAAPSPSSPSPSGPIVSSSAYANPFRSANITAHERIDQGVDLAGSGPVYALGDGTVLATKNAGWPPYGSGACYETFIAYRLSNGPAAGDTVYIAQSIAPTVSVGQTVTPNTVVGDLCSNGGIEIGWANGSALGLTMAATYGQFDSSNSTAFGYNFDQLLASLGGPQGSLQNNPPTGSVPASWPQW